MKNSSNPAIIRNWLNSAKRMQMNHRFAATNKCILTWLADSALVLCCIFPLLRHSLGRAGIMPGLFGNRVVRVPMRKGSGNLLLTGLDNVHLSFRLFWSGIDYHEPFTRVVIESLTRSTDVFIDLGANIGFFSLVAAKLNPRLEVIAFEPNPAMFALLLEHKRLNGLSNLTAEAQAVSNRDGKAQLFLNSSNMSASLEPEFQKNFNPAVGCVPVETTSLDSYVQRHGISGSLVLKVDVEGHEEAALAGARQTIAQLRPDIIIEVLELFSPAALQQFRNLGYRFYRITHHGLIEAEVVNLTRIGDFVFLNYLFTTKSTGEADSISQIIRNHARRIDLYRTSKFAQHPISASTSSSSSSCS